MARTVRNAKIDTRSSRSRLVERREPYWTVVSRGCGIGYRRGAKGGTWIARCRDDRGKQHYEALGAADDAREADGQTVFTFSQAQELARKFFARAARREDGEETAVAGPATVKQALDDYFAARERRGSKSVSADRYAAEARHRSGVGLCGSREAECQETPFLARRGCRSSQALANSQVGDEARYQGRG